MSVLGLIPEFSVAVGATGEVARGDFTKLGLYVGLLGPDLLYKQVERSAMGSKAIGLGSLYIENAGTNKLLVKPVEGQYTENVVHMYFYKTEGNPLTVGKVPSFMTPSLTIDESKIIAYVSNKVSNDTIRSIKEGLVMDREGVFNLLGTISGITAKWEPGKGTGQFDAVCVSLVDLHKIKNDPNITDESMRHPVYMGTMFATDAYTYSNQTEIAYVCNGITGLTAANEILVKMKGKPGLLVNNLDTGDITPFAGTYTGYLAIWGTQMVKMENGKWYGLTFGAKGSDVELPTSPSSYCYIFSYDPTTNTSVISSQSWQWFETKTLLKVGTTLYFAQENQSYNSTSSSYYKQYYPVNLDTLSVSGTMLTFTNVPTHLTTYNTYKVENGPEGSYLLHDLRNLITYRFTNLADISGTITDVYFVGCGCPITRTVDTASYTVFLAALAQGFHNEGDNRTNATYPQRILKNVQYSGMKYMMLDGDISPLLAYGAFSKIYEKSADTSFTTNYYITARNVVTA